MKGVLKKCIRAILHPVISKLGYRKYENDPKLSLSESFYMLLKNLGFLPTHVVDVGANHGNWTRMLLQYFPDSYYTLFEPQHWLKTSIDDLLKTNKKITFNAIGVGKESGSFKFTVVNRDDSSSFRFTPAEAEEYGFNQIEVPIITLNDFLLEKSHLPVPEIIKIDAEGLDLDVLEGASKFMGLTEIFIIEAAIGLKDVKNDIRTVINYMDLKGYRLFEITELNRPFALKILWLSELVFVKRMALLIRKYF